MNERSGSGAPGIAWGGLHLGALWALAVAQPHFEFLDSGEAFVLFGWSPLEIVLYTVVVVTTAPALMVGAEALVRVRGERYRWLLHLLFVGVLLAVFCGYLIKRVDADARAPVFLLAIFGGGVGALGYARLSQLRSLVSFLSPAPVLVAGLFLLGSNVTPLVFPRQAESASPPRNPVPVVMIVFDELPTVSLMDRQGNLDESSYPNFARLARRATWFRNATTVADLTSIAVPAILTGTFDVSGDPPSHRAYPNNLFSLLGSSHQLQVYEIFGLCPADRCSGNEPRDLPSRLTAPLPALLKASASSFAPNALIARLPTVHPLEELSRLAGFEDLGRDLSAGGAPPLFFVHSLFPHIPWDHLPSGTRVAGSGCCWHEFIADVRFFPQLDLPMFPGDRWRDDQDLVRGMQQRHLAQMRFTDRLLGRALDRLETSGLLDEALVVVTADHGISFRAGDSRRYLSETNRAEILGVPLFVKRPGQRRGRVEDANVQTIDILPTIAELLGIDVPWAIHGQPLFPDPPDRDTLSAARVLTGETFQFPAESIVGDRDAAVREIHQVFGGEEGRGPQLFRFGPEPRLLGRRARAVAGEAAVDAGVSLDDPEAYRAVDPASNEIPAWIRGTVTGRQAGDVEALAIALEGRIAATLHVHDVDGVMRFYGLIPESAFRRGENTVEILASGGAWQGLARLPIASERSDR